MVDWGKGRYENTAAELQPAAEAVVSLAAPAAGERVLDVACGTGNAALLAAARGANAVGVDSSERLVDVARQRAGAAGVIAEFVVGDALALPVADASCDVVVSIFGVIFAADPSRAIGEIARALRPGGRAYITAWVPSGPLDAMLTVVGRAVVRATGAAPATRFAWSDRDAIRELAEAWGLASSTTKHELEIRAASTEAYVDAGREHPMAIDVWPLLERAGRLDGVREEMIQVLDAANEGAPGLLIRSPYVIHHLWPTA